MAKKFAIAAPAEEPKEEIVEKVSEFGPSNEEPLVDPVEVAPEVVTPVAPAEEVPVAAAPVKAPKKVKAEEPLKCSECPNFTKASPECASCWSAKRERGEH